MPPVLILVFILIFTSISTKPKLRRTPKYAKPLPHHVPSGLRLAPHTSRDHAGLFIPLPHETTPMKLPTRMSLAIVHLPSQQPSVIHQVVIDPSKIRTLPRGDLIRLGDYPGDEAVGWQRIETIELLDTIGAATFDSETKTLTVTPEPSDA